MDLAFPLITGKILNILHSFSSSNENTHWFNITFSNQQLCFCALDQNVHTFIKIFGLYNYRTVLSLFAYTSHTLIKSKERKLKLSLAPQVAMVKGESWFIILVCNVGIQASLFLSFFASLVSWTPLYYTTARLPCDYFHGVVACDGKLNS